MIRHRNHQLAILPMRRKDASVVSAMMEELQGYHGDRSLATANDFAQFCLGQQKMSSVWLAWIGSTAVGFIVFYDWINFVRMKKIRRLDLLFIKEEFRGQGVGKTLVAKLIKDGQRRNIRRFDVSAEKKNAKATKFYKALGFKKRDSHSQDYHMDDLLMKKAIKSIEIRT